MLVLLSIPALRVFGFGVLLSRDKLLKVNLSTFWLWIPKVLALLTKTRLMILEFSLWPSCSPPISSTILWVLLMKTHWTICLLLLTSPRTFTLSLPMAKKWIRKNTPSTSLVSSGSSEISPYNWLTLKAIPSLPTNIWNALSKNKRAIPMKSNLKIESEDCWRLSSNKENAWP